jgi:hypothetical protein
VREGPTCLDEVALGEMRLDQQPLRTLPQGLYGALSRRGSTLTAVIPCSQALFGSCANRWRLLASWRPRGYERLVSRPRRSCSAW